MGSIREMSRRVAKTRKPRAANDAARAEPTESLEVPEIRTDRWEDSLVRMLDEYYIELARSLERKVPAATRVGHASNLIDNTPYCTTKIRSRLSCLGIRLEVFHIRNRLGG